MTQKNREISGPAKVGLGVLGIVQLAFAFLAAWDLWHRRSDEVNGSKAVWAPVLLVQWLGPAAYFLFGIKYK